MGITLPMHIILSCILPKLPAKSLIRFKCVSKSFLAEISSPKFIKQHHRNVISSNSNRLLIFDSPEGVYVYDLDSPHSLPSFCPYPEVTFYVSYRSVVATCEGYLLMKRDAELFLLNPSTRTYRKICTYYNNALYGMWRCPDKYDEYKIVQFVNTIGNGGFDVVQVNVYNLKTNTWKLVESKTSIESLGSWCDNTPVLVQNHLLHLLFFDENHGPLPGRMNRIGCFDMKAERWANDVQLSDVLRDEFVFDFPRRRPWNLGVLDDQLCFKGFNNVIESSFELWVMKEYGVKDSWVKLISLPVSNNVIVDCRQLCQEFCHPITYRTRSPHELLYIKGGLKLYWYNLRDKEVVEAEFPLPPLDNRPIWEHSLSAYICKGSLLNFPSGRPIQVSLEEEDGYEDKVGGGS